LPAHNIDASRALLWRRLRPGAARLEDRTFVAVGAASGFGSALVGSVGPLVAPFFLKYSSTAVA
jgi:hypothetical protein